MAWLRLARGMAYGFIVTGACGALVLLVSLSGMTWVPIAIFGVGVVMLALTDRELRR